MPASTNLLKVLAAAEDPSQSLEDEIGCMTGIFQMFDRSQSFTGSSRRRYGSKRVISAAAVHSRQVSACESPHHDTSNSSVHMFEDNAPAAKKAGNLKHIKATAVDLSRDHLHRGYSDSNNIVIKTCKAAPVPMQDQQQHATDDQKNQQQHATDDQKNQQQHATDDQKNQQQLDQECTHCEDPSLYQSQVNSMSVVQDSDQSSSFPHNHCEEHQKLPRVSLRLDSASEGSRVSSKDLRKVPFLDIRDIVRASFYRERSSRDSSSSTNGKEKARALLDLSHESFLSKSLPRSSSVNGWDHRLQMSVDRREDVCCSSSVELPRCSSVDARMGGSQMLGDWRTTSSLRSSSVKSPRRTAAAAAGLLRDKKDVSKVASVVVDSKDWMSRTSVDSKFARHFSSPLDGKDVTRLMVELKEDPRLSVSGSKDEHQGVFNNDRNSPRPPSPGARYYPESRDPAAAAATTTAFFNFRETRQSADLKDPCGSASCTPKVRDGNLPRFSIDAARDPPRASMSPRLSVDSRDSPRPSALLPRLKLDRRDSMQPAKLSCRDACGASSQLKTDNVVAEGDGQGEEIESHRRIPNVVARLMGLEELPGSSSDPSHNRPAKSVVPQTKTPSSLSSREVQLLQGQFLEHYTPPPPPRQSDDYNYKQQQREEFQQLKKECPIPSHAMQSSIKSSSSSSSLPGPNQKETRPESSLHHLHCYYDQDLPLQYQQEEGFWTHAQEKIGGAQPQMKAPLSDVVLTALKQTDEETKHLTSGQEPPCSLMHQEIHQLRTYEKSVQGRTFFRYILKALQLKGPLHSPHHKESRNVNTAAHQTVVPKPIVEESKTRMQMLKQKFLVPSSPRRTITVPKQENAHQAAGYQGFAATKVSQPVDLLSTIVHHEELLIAMKQTNSCAAPVQDTGTIMHGSIPNTFMIAPKCIDEDPVMNEMTTSSHHPSSPAPPGDLLDSISSRSWSSGRSAVISSVQTNTLHASSSSSSMNNGVACKGGENDEAAANRRSSQVHQVQTSSGTSRHEPHGSGSSDIEAATTPRMTRKERITARSAKGSQEGTQGARDTSARSPRLSPLPQGKHGLSSFPVKEANPLRPGSSSPGMRCMTGTGQCPQLLENGKKAAWSKPFMVKDREDSKVTLNTLRVQSTKQEFLKGRASTGPDTLRTYNRRSSESSKLISRITEKLTATNAAAAVSSTKAHGRRLPISENPILSSKRSTGKHSNPAVNSKTTSCALDIETTRPAENTSTKEKVDFLNEDVAPVVLATAAADDNMERDETNNVELMMESIQPNAAEESRLDLRTTVAELDERGGISEVLTPRGVSVKKNKYPFSEFGPAEVVDQPSPVSVLDNFHFQEEDLSPSPRRASKPSTTNPAEDVFDSPQRHDLEETQAAALKGVTDIIGSTQNFSNHDNLHINRRNHVEIQIPIDSTQETYSPKNTHGICLQNKDDERKYVRDILVASGVTESASSINCLQWTTGEFIMDLTHFNDMESKWQQRQPPNTKENDFFDYEKNQPCSEKEALGRRVLFDGTNEILFQKLDPVRFSPLQWLGIDWPHVLQQKPAGQQLVQEVWDELQDVPCVPSSENNICDTLYTILHKDFRNAAKQWSGMDGELSHISSDVEHMIVKELIEEVVKDLVSGFSSSCNLSTHKPVEAITRRLLFAH